MAAVSDQVATIRANFAGFGGLFADLRQRDFARLDEAGHTYLDYTGAALYPSSLLTRHSDTLRQSILGNPHSLSPASETSSTLLSASRERVLDFLRADPREYAVIFTANATAAIKLIAEGFPFSSESEFLLSNDNHNSVNGIREYARAKGASVRYLPVGEDLGLTPIVQDFRRPKTRSHSLFSYPAQSNFSGVLHSLDAVAIAQEAGYRVLLDAAAFVPGHRLDLTKVSPDFVCISFYKMFGYPTGIGALVARKTSLALIRRPWFSGGTVDFVSTQHPDIHQLVTHEHAFEDGSPNFTSMQGVIDGLNYLEALGILNIEAHTTALIDRLVTGTKELRHDNGEPLVRWYGGTHLTYGGARAFNVLDKNGVVIPYELVEQLAGFDDISIRGGCFCNPGCAEAAFKFPREQTSACLKRLADSGFSPSRFAECLDTTEVGALRVSVGIANNDTDIDRFTSFIRSFKNYPCQSITNSDRCQ